MKWQYLIFLAGAIIGFFICFLFRPTITEIETVEVDRVTETDTVITKREYYELVENPDTITITETQIVYVDSTSEVKKSRISFSDNFIVGDHKIQHTGEIIDSELSYILKTRLVRQDLEVVTVTNNIYTTRTIRTIIEPSNKIISSITVAPETFIGTIGFKHKSGIGVSVGQNFHNDDLAFQLSYEFTPSQILKNIPFL